MKSKFLKKNQVSLLILFLLISIAILILTQKSEKVDRQSTIKTEVKKENKTLEPKPKMVPKVVIETKKKVELKKQNSTSQENLVKISPYKTPIADKIDFVGKSDPLIDLKPTLEIDQIMAEQRKINTFGEKKYLLEKKEDWEVDYGVGLEDGAMEDLKSNPSFKRGMLNGKIEFSTSF